MNEGWRVAGRAERCRGRHTADYLRPIELEVPLRPAARGVQERRTFLRGSKEHVVIKRMHDEGVTSGHMYVPAAAHVAAVTVLWIKAERSGDATRQRRALALSPCPPIYQLRGIALKLEETTG